MFFAEEGRYVFLITSSRFGHGMFPSSVSHKHFR
uniref:Uncharacterized protein n=1 Tax=Parascaris equorum TaxID=6256 RepID=A0A914RJ01_PAREQ